VPDSDALLQRAWELSYLDPLAARDLGRRLTAATSPHIAEGWLLVALCEVRAGDAPVALQALAQARLAFAAGADAARQARGVALCDEVQAIGLRRAGNFEGSAALQDELDRRGGFECDAMHRYIAHNSRAITARLLGKTDAALQHFYDASDAAQQTGWAGPCISAWSNLGSLHQDLFNLEDARALSEKAWHAAGVAGATTALFASTANLIVIHYATGDLQRARAMAEFLLHQQAGHNAARLERYALPLALGHLASGEIDAALRFLEVGVEAAMVDGDHLTFRAWLQARCLLACRQPAQALATAERALLQRQRRPPSDRPYDAMELHRALADAAEQTGDAVAALRYLRQAHTLYEQLVGRSARAHQVALQVSHQLAQAQRERDAALDGRRTAEDDHRRVAELNTALQVQIAETEMLHAKLREQALRDPLTGLHNRRYLFEVAPGMMELARRQGKQLCVVLMDLDHFKLLNDTCGHAAGDLVLQRFAELLVNMLRRSDVICRHGGEEFVALMPDIDAEGARTTLARLLEAYSTQQFELGRRRLPRGSFSAGVVLFPRHGHTLEQLLSRADRALYAAKNHGRARIEMAPRTGFATLD
jgi:diguanylate cyclase (GGDEF)-like protein